MLITEHHGRGCLFEYGTWENGTAVADTKTPTTGTRGRQTIKCKGVINQEGESKAQKKVKKREKEGTKKTVESDGKRGPYYSQQDKKEKIEGKGAKSGEEV